MLLPISFMEFVNNIYSLRIGVVLMATYLIWGMLAAFIGVAAASVHRVGLLTAGIASIASAWLLQQAIGFLWFQPRPFIAFPSYPHVVNVSIHSKAFPSDHTAIAFAIATVIALVEPKYKIPFLISAVLVGVGRILGGVHYPIDVLVGAVVGMMMSWVMNKLIV